MTKVRCQEGWRLFFKIGELYTAMTNMAPMHRDWSKHADAVEEHKKHIEDCDYCRNGIKELQMTLEEMAVEGVS